MLLAPPPHHPPRVEIPALGISAPLGRGVSPSTLARGAGHYPGTSWPGRPGTVGLAGHDVTPVPGARGGHVFGNLAVARERGRSVIGDRVVVFWRGTRYEYRITKQEIVPPGDYSVLKGPRYGRRLVMTTCYPRFTALHRLVTVAWRVRR
jgi:sortase A